MEKGTVLQIPFTDCVQMVAVESGSTNVGTWVTEQRNIRKDYRQAFGEEPPINGLAIMTDTDNTGESATAYYGNIVGPVPGGRSSRGVRARPVKLTGLDGRRPTENTVFPSAAARRPQAAVIALLHVHRALHCGPVARVGAHVAVIAGLGGGRKGD